MERSKYSLFIFPNFQIAIKVKTVESSEINLTNLKLGILIDRYSLSTKRWKIDPDQFKTEDFQGAVQLLHAGGLVAFPTETVYGLGAIATNEEAVHKIFRAKSRPSQNPLIVHVASVSQAQSLILVWPENADLLAKHFWPGPLTMILPRNSIIPNAVTGGGDTVALRIPAHPIALTLLKEVGSPIAAPSANRSTELSPTTAEHVLKSLDGRIDGIIDGGPSWKGIESTIIDLTKPVPTLLRPGPISPDQLIAFLGKLEIQQQFLDINSSPMLAPGQLKKHYAPRTKLIICTHNNLASLIDKISEETKKIGLISHSNQNLYTLNPSVYLIRLEPTPAKYAELMFSALHTLDEASVDLIIVEAPPDGSDWLGVRDRLSRAAYQPS